MPGFMPDTHALIAPPQRRGWLGIGEAVTPFFERLSPIMTCIPLRAEYFKNDTAANLMDERVLPKPGDLVFNEQFLTF
jgi:hypothetical protein